ncbi:MAG: hypothetical protein QW409_03520 [Candidatus Aenigmatarchaeota archaeon]
MKSKYNKENDKFFKVFFKSQLFLLFLILSFIKEGVSENSTSILLSSINWIVLQEGGLVEITNDKSFNLTHLRGNLGDVALISFESFNINNTPIEINITFKIFDVVDPSGGKSYGEAETRQRILLIDAYNFSSILPFDFGFLRH